MIRIDKKFIVLLLLSFLVVKLGFAQTPEEIESKMDEIRVDGNCAYGESSNEDKDIAFQNALTDLTIFANELRTGKGKDVIRSSDLLTVVKELQYQKRGLFTVLVYLPMNQMLEMTSKLHSDIISQNVPTSHSQSDNKTQQSLRQEQKPTFVPNRQIAASSTASTPMSLPDDITQTLCSQDNWLEIKGFLTSYKAEGKILSIGNVLSYAEVPDDAYAILMDDMGGILSILSPRNSQNRINYRTNQADNETNHSNCKFIVWYK